MADFMVFRRPLEEDPTSRQEATPIPTANTIRTTIGLPRNLNLNQPMVLDVERYSNLEAPISSRSGCYRYLQIRGGQTIPDGTPFLHVFPYTESVCDLLDTSLTTVNKRNTFMRKVSSISGVKGCLTFLMFFVATYEEQVQRFIDFRVAAVLGVLVLLMVVCLAFNMDRLKTARRGFMIGMVVSAPVLAVTSIASIPFLTVFLPSCQVAAGALTIEYFLIGVLSLQRRYDVLKGGMIAIIVSMVVLCAVSVVYLAFMKEEQKLLMMACAVATILAHTGALVVFGDMMMTDARFDFNSDHYVLAALMLYLSQMTPYGCVMLWMLYTRRTI